MTIIDNLKAKVREAEDLVIETSKLYLEMKREVKTKELELKKSKTYLYRSHRNWVRAKKAVIKTKSKLSRYPRETRQWAKNHPDKVFVLMEKELSNKKEGDKT